MPKRSRTDDDNDEHTRSSDKATWTRIMNRRQQDFNELNSQTVVSILTSVPRPPNSSIPATGMSPRQQLHEIMWEHMEIAGDTTMPVAQRRQSWEAITKITSLVDKELKRAAMHIQSTVATSRSVLDRIDLSATSSTVPAGSIPSDNSNVGVGTNLAQNAGVTAQNAAGNLPVHPIMRQSSASTTNLVATAPIHPIMLGELPSTLSTGTQGTSAAVGFIHPVLQNNVANTSGPAITATTTATATTRRPSTAPVNSTSSVTNGSAPIYPSMMTSNNPSGNVNAPSTGKTAMQRNSSSASGIANAAGALNAAVRRTSSANSTVPVHLSMQRNSSSVSTTIGAAQTSSGTNNNSGSVNSVPAHPPMRSNSSSTGAVTLAGGATAVTTNAASVNDSGKRAFPSMQQTAPMTTTTTITGGLSSTTSNSSSLNAAGNPSMQAHRKSSSTGTASTANGVTAAPITTTNTAASDGASNLPVHSSMHTNSSSSSTTTTGTASATTSSGSGAGNEPVHSAVQTNSSSAGTTSGTSTGTPSTTTTASKRKNAGSTSSRGQNRTTINGQGSSSSSHTRNVLQSGVNVTNRNRGVSTATEAGGRNPHALSSNGQSASATPTSEPTTANPAVSRQTSNSNSIGSQAQNLIGSQAQRTTSTPKSITSQGGSNTSGPNPTQPDDSRPAGPSSANQGFTGTGTSTNALRTNQHSTASRQTTASTTSATGNTENANGGIVIKPTNLAVAARTAPKVGQSGAISSDDKAKENQKPIAARKLGKDTDATEIIKFDEKPTKLDFPADPPESKWTGCYKSRPKCTVTFKKISAIRYGDAFSIRLASSEPYWMGVKNIHFGMTSKVDKVEWSKGARHPTNEPKTVWTFNFNKWCDELIADKIIKKWGDESEKEPKEGEFRLLLRMLPVDVDEKMKKKRADCHLWPKGTMLLVDDKVVPDLVQRKQQSHCLSEWKGMCKHFDLSSAIKFPLHKHKIQLCSCEAQQYYISITVCQYRSPQFLFRKLLGKEPECKNLPCHELERLSLEASMEKAKGLINQQAIVLDDEIEKSSNNNGLVGKFVFSLIDPVAKKAIVTPVRGRKCKHWQCFDLDNFLNSNVAVTGNRWRCPCCELFLKYNELQLCALTMAALDKFRDQVTPNRGRVEFRLDETYELLPEEKLRYSKTKNNTSGTGNLERVRTKEAPGEPKPRPLQQEIEIIEIDSD